MKIIISGKCTVECDKCGNKNEYSLKGVREEFAYDYNFGKMIENMRVEGIDYAVCKCGKLITLDDLEVRDLEAQQ